MKTTVNKDNKKLDDLVKRLKEINNDEEGSSEDSGEIGNISLIIEIHSISFCFKLNIQSFQLLLYFIYFSF